MMSYINETDFVIENKKLVYPEIVTDGLQLYYDAKGKRDTDYHRDTMLDMSGNNNHGKLHNFAYEKHSGYKDGLVFDYIDDKLIRPTLNLKPNDFTFMLNGNIISFSPDGTVKRVQDGEVIESKGFNLVRNGDFRDGLAGWSVIAGTLSLTETEYNSFPNSFYKPTPTDALYRDVSLPNNHIIYLSAFVKGTNKMELRMHQYKTWTRIKVVTIESSDEWTLLSLTGLSNNGGIRIDTSVSDGENYYDDFIVIDLTETFGAGNEPTKEQMDEIINRFGYIPNAQDLIDHIEYKGNDLGDMENIIDGLYKTEVLSGEEIYTDKADDNAGVHVEVDGKSYQHAGSGKNLFPSAPIMKGYYHSSSGSYVSSESSTLSLAFVPVVKGKTYSWNKTIEGRVIIMTFNSSKEPLERILAYSGEVLTSTSFNENVSFVQFSSFNSNNYDFSDFQFEEGSTVTAYEPPAPTPDYPIEIHSLNDFDVVSSVGKRNLLPNSLKASLAFNNNGGVDTQYKEGFIQIMNVGAGRALSTYNSNSFDFSKLIDGEEYTYSYMVNPSIDSNMYIDWRKSKNTVLVKANMWTRISYTQKYDASDRNSYLMGVTSSINTSAVTYKLTKPKIEKGNKATPWTPAPEDIIEDSNQTLIDKINLLLDEPLRSVGDVKDRLFRDSDGLWKIERNVGETQLGSTDITNISIGASNNVVTTIKIDNIKYYTSSYGAPLRSTHHGRMKGNPGSSWGNAENIRNATITTNGTMWLSVDKESIDTVEKARNWFESQETSGTPIIVQYALETPTIEVLPQILQDKLNNLHSFEDSNYVYTVLPNEDNYLSDNLKPTLHAKFLYNNWYKEDRVINNLMIYNRALTNEEMLQNYKTIKRRWGM